MPPSVPLGTFGLGWIDQRVPFHSSTSGVVPELEVELPTAKQTFGCGHETPFSVLKVAPGGLGVGTICQLAPSQCSATVAEGVGSLKPAGNSAFPTAMHEFAAVQSTALRLVSFAPGTFGVGGTVHAAEAAQGVSSNAAVAIKTRRTGRSDICCQPTPPVWAGQAPPTPFRALDVCKRIAEDDGHPVTARRLADAGLPKIRLHDLRHTHATLALAAGVHPTVVQERLGHATIAITLDTYSHAIPAMQEDAAETIAALLAD
jgi:hypothetical protein